MSHRAHRRRHRTAVDVTDLADLVAAACVLRGCTCKPDIRVDRRSGHIRVEHDAWCPATAPGRDYLTTPPHRPKRTDPGVTP